MTEIRKAGPEDAGIVAELYLRSRHASVPAYPAPVHDDDDVRGWVTTVVIPAGDTWVIERDDTIVAMLVLDERGVDHLHVDPDQTGQGLGSTLLDFAKHHRPTGLDLWVFRSNEGARRFYARHGFTEIDRTAGDNEEGEPDVLLRWAPD